MLLFRMGQTLFLGLSVYGLFVIASWLLSKPNNESPVQAMRPASMDAAPPASTMATSGSPEESARLYYDKDGDGYKSVLGIIREGLPLYYKTPDHKPFGIITGVESGKIEVALDKTVSIGNSGLHGYAVWFQRSYITENFVTK